GRPLRRAVRAVPPQARQAGAGGGMGRGRRHVLEEHGRDLSFITLRVLDAKGRAVPDADARVRFRIDGAAELVATDNGDPRDLTAFPSAERNAFGGLALAIVRGLPGRSGTARVSVEADGLEGAVLELRVAPAVDAH